MNVVLLIGRLTRDPELRYLATGTPVATFSIAVDREFTGKDGQRQADFFNIIVWGKPGENCANYLAKGRLVAVKGRIQNNNYETQTGEKRYSTEIVAERVQFLDRGDKAQGGAPRAGTPATQGSYDGGQRPTFEPKGDAFHPSAFESKGDTFNPATYEPQGLDEEGYRALDEDDVPF